MIDYWWREPVKKRGKVQLNMSDTSVQHPVFSLFSIRWTRYNAATKSSISNKKYAHQGHKNSCFIQCQMSMWSEQTTTLGVRGRSDDGLVACMHASRFAKSLYHQHYYYNNYWELRYITIYSTSLILCFPFASLVHRYMSSRYHRVGMVASDWIGCNCLSMTRGVCPPIFYVENLDFKIAGVMEKQLRPIRASISGLSIFGKIWVYPPVSFW